MEALLRGGFELAAEYQHDDAGYEAEADEDGPVSHEGDALPQHGGDA